MPKTIQENKKIILFDGVCNLCNNAVKFIIERDREDVFRFASLQSEIGKKLTSERGINTSEPHSIILIEPGVAYYQKSTAAIEISKHLSGSYSLINYLKFLPEGLRDMGYDIIADNRYKWFGKKESCMLPTHDLQAKFLK